MTVDTASILTPTLRTGANREQIIAALGDPHDTGAGLRGFTILAYREKTIQCTLREKRLFHLAFYFHKTSSTPWPEGLAALADFTHPTRPSDIEAWLSQRQIPSQRISICDELAIEAPVGVRFHFESGHLSSIQITSTAPADG